MLADEVPPDEGEGRQLREGGQEDEEAGGEGPVHLAVQVVNHQSVLIRDHITGMETHV